MQTNPFKKIPLKEITVKINSGATPRGGENSYKSKGIPLIRSQNVLNFKFTYKGLAFIDDEQANNLCNADIFKDDILINITGEAVARCCLVPNNLVPARVNQHVIRIRVDKDEVNPLFLVMSLNSPLNKKKLLKLASIGATRKALTKEMIKEFIIDFPPKIIQDKIADYIDLIISNIELNIKMNSTLDKIAFLTFKSWLVHFEVFREENFEESDLGKIPKGWKVISISDIAEYINGKAFTVKATPTGKMIIKIAELKKGKNSTTKYYNKKVEDENKAFFDDILFAWSASLGIFRWHGEEGVINQHIFKVIPKGFPKWFVYYNIRIAMKWFKTIAKSKATTMGHIKRSHLKEYKIIKPPNEIIDELHLIINPFYTKIAYNNSKINNLIKLRDLLLPHLISGRLRIKNLEKMGEKNN